MNLIDQYSVYCIGQSNCYRTQSTFPKPVSDIDLTQNDLEESQKCVISIIIIIIIIIVIDLFYIY